MQPNDSVCYSPSMSATAERLVESARALIVRRGYSGFSYADVADDVGIRKASIHHHFPAKVDLVRAVLAVHRVNTARNLEQLAAVPPAKQLRIYADHWAACIRDDSAPFCVAAMLAAELPALPSELAADVRAHFRQLSTWIATVLAKGSKEGTFTLGASAAVEAESFLASVHGAMLSARAYADPAVFETIARAAISRVESKAPKRR